MRHLACGHASSNENPWPPREATDRDDPVSAVTRLSLECVCVVLGATPSQSYEMVVKDVQGGKGEGAVLGGFSRGGGGGRHGFPDLACWLRLGSVILGIVAWEASQVGLRLE